MTLNPITCQIRTPTCDALLPLYEMLMEVFPVDRPVFTEMAGQGKRFYTWTPYALYLDDVPVGNVSLMPMRIWLDGQPFRLVGVASVATSKPYRRQGIARRLLEHTMRIVDEENVPAILFTSVPALYEPFGFQPVEQTPSAVPTANLNLPGKGPDADVVNHLSDARLEQVAELYTNEYPNYDGKVVRDADYWLLYQMLFNVFARHTMLCCTHQGQTVGYARVEAKKDRLLLAELVCNPSATNVAEALLRSAKAHALKHDLPWITLALPPKHFAWQLLNYHRITPQAEPPGAKREPFMARPAPSQPPGPLAHLQWSLVDEF
jgi:predicted N-acetyltransferase YhbS